MRRVTAMIALSSNDVGVAPSEPACTMRARKVRLADLPLSCPMPGQCLWNAHPRVYLALDSEGHAQCPYCGTSYELDTQVQGKKRENG